MLLETLSGSLELRIILGLLNLPRAHLSLLPVNLKFREGFRSLLAVILILLIGFRSLLTVILSLLRAILCLLSGFLSLPRVHWSLLTVNLRIGKAFEVSCVL